MTAEEIMALRLMMEKLITHAGDCERRLALERQHTAHLEGEMMKWAARLGKAEAQIATGDKVKP